MIRTDFCLTGPLKLPSAVPMEPSSPFVVPQAKHSVTSLSSANRIDCIMVHAAASENLDVGLTVA